MNAIKDGVIKKKTLGRRKIPIHKIQKPSSLQVAFTKRRTGLFKKATELSLLCGAHIVMLVQSPAHKMFAFGTPSVEALLRRFEALPSSEEENYWETMEGRLRESEIRRYGEKLMELEAEKEREREWRGKEEVGELWWDMAIEEMGVQQLEEYAAAMGGLRENVLRRLEEMEKLRTTTTTTSHRYETGGADNTTSHLQQQDCSETAEMTTNPPSDGFGGCDIPVPLLEIQQYLDFSNFDSVEWNF